MSDAAPAATTETTPTPAAEAAPAPATTAAPGSILGGEAPAATTEPVKPAEPAAPVVPEKYEFTPPEVDGKPVTVDADALTAFEEDARKAGLTQAQFQAVTAAGASRIAQLAAAPYAAWNAQQSEWQAAIKADPDIGGDKLAPAIAEAAIALDAFGGAELRQALIVTGAGNHPAIVKAFVQVGRMMADPSRVVSGKPGPGPKHPEQSSRDFYNAVGGNYPAVQE